MRFWRKKAHRVLVVGIFQSVETGRAVLQNLHRARFRRAAAIHASAKGRQRVEEQGILRDVEAVAPVTFGFYPPPPFSVEPTERPLSHELPSSQRLVENAASLASAIAVSRGAKPRGPSFLHRLLEIEDALEWANMGLTMSADAHHAFKLSAEWLLDNAYLIREQVTDLRKSLPQKQYGKLPLIASGPEAGLPRVYHVASEIVAESGGALEPEFIGKFLVAFQATAPLDIGQL